MINPEHGGNCKCSTTKISPSATTFPRLLDSSELHRFKPSQLSPLGETLLKIKTQGQGELKARSMQIWG